MRAHHLAWLARPGAFATFAAFAVLAALHPSIAKAQDAPPPAGVPPTPATAETNAATTPAATEGNVPGAPVSPEEKSEVPDDREERSAQRNRFAGSIILVDQSVTTASFDRNAQLSYSPLYELWVSPRVYYAPIEGLKFGVRFDFFKEM
ncbi:MAG: hypothetical protein ABI175_30285, partial [Polyangiales bacterium]